jgi:hypothetical protein
MPRGKNILIMFVPSELLGMMCTYLPNSDLISMARVCKHWNLTCVRHLSAHLGIATMESSHQKLQHYLDNFEGRGQHHRIPTRPAHIKSITINLDLHKALDLSKVYALLDHLQHVRTLYLHATLNYE